MDEFTTGAKKGQTMFVTDKPLEMISQQMLSLETKKSDLKLV